MMQPEFNEKPQVCLAVFLFYFILFTLMSDYKYADASTAALSVSAASK